MGHPSGQGRPIGAALPIGLWLILGLGCGFVVLTGCTTKPAPDEDVEPLVFRSLDLRQSNDEGKPAWDLSSPEARYEIGERRAVARAPRGTLYNDGKPRYRISARKGTVVDDGEKVVLSGDVRICMVGDDPFIILAPEVVWLPGEERMLIDRKPVAIDRQSRLSATSARFQVADQTLRLLGKAKLERWPEPDEDRAPIGPTSANPQVRLLTGPVSWDLDSGKLRAKGPVRGQRHQPDSAPQILRASSLEGNSIEGYIDLLAPVRVEGPREGGWMEGGQARWRFSDQQLSSPAAFRARIGDLTILGRGYRIAEKETVVAIENDCDLKQPGERLQANRCRWDWANNALLAEGAVQLRREANDQITSAQKLEGRIGKNGRATFNTPGGRVRSELTVPSWKSFRDGTGSTAPQAGPAPPVEF